MLTHLARWRLIRELLGAGQQDAALAECAADAALLLQLCQYHLSMGNHTAARDIALDLDRQFIDKPYQMDALGTLLSECGEQRRALEYFECAVEAAPENVAFRFNLAMAQRRAGALRLAEANLDIVLAANPLDGEAQNARSGLRKQTRRRNHVDELQRVLRRLKGKRGVVAVQFALAKELDDLGEYPRSFAHLTEGCRRFRASFQYDVADDVALLEALRREHSTERLMSRKCSLSSDRPIFIVGLPESGAVLIEEILTSHADVASAGESAAFPRVLETAVAARYGPTSSALELVDRSLELNFEELGSAYLKETAVRAGTAARFLDLLPLNFLHAGLIHAAVPRAKFIAIRRHPLDVCYALYRTLFGSAWRFTYDLTELARYYVAWDRLMRHWQAVTGSAWLTVHYESLVLDPERNARMLLAHCGLAWQDRCLIQSRPQYVDSIDKWRPHARKLQPLRLYLESHGVSCEQPENQPGRSQSIYRIG